MLLSLLMGCAQIASGLNSLFDPPENSLHGIMLGSQVDRETCSELDPGVFQCDGPKVGLITLNTLKGQVNAIEYSRILISPAELQYERETWPFSLCTLKDTKINNEAHQRAEIFLCPEGFYAMRMISTGYTDSNKFSYLEGIYTPDVADALIEKTVRRVERWQ